MKKNNIEEAIKATKETFYFCTVIICIIAAFLIFSCTRGYASTIEPPAKLSTNVVKEFNESQFILSLEEPKEVIECFLYIVDHSSLTVSIDSWNYFVSKINKFQAAYKAALRGWSIDFDQI